MESQKENWKDRYVVIGTIAVRVRESQKENWKVAIDVNVVGSVTIDVWISKRELKVTKIMNSSDISDISESQKENWKTQMMN